MMSDCWVGFRVMHMSLIKKNYVSHAVLLGASVKDGYIWVLIVVLYKVLWEAVRQLVFDTTSLTAAIKCNSTELIESYFIHPHMIWSTATSLPQLIILYRRFHCGVLVLNFWYFIITVRATWSLRTCQWVPILSFSNPFAVVCFFFFFFGSERTKTAWELVRCLTLRVVNNIEF